MNYDKNLIENIRSNSLKELANSLIDLGYKITFYGQAWSKETNNWIYFDTVLDLEQIKRQFQFKGNIKIHINTDSKSGKEKGFIDVLTNEGLMGKYE